MIMASGYESIAQGLQEAIDLNKGEKVAAKTHSPINAARCGVGRPLAGRGGDV